MTPSTSETVLGALGHAPGCPQVKRGQHGKGVEWVKDQRGVCMCVSSRTPKGCERVMHDPLCEKVSQIRWEIPDS